MKRRIRVITDYDSFEIVNLKRVWVNRFAGRYSLMYQDDKYEYNCIYWNCNPNHNFHRLKEKLWEAYNNGNAVVEL